MAGDSRARKGTAGRRRTGEARLRESRLLPPEAHTDTPDPDAVVDLGWGRLIFANTFDDTETLAETILREEEDERDIAIYVHDPHVLLAAAPQALFLDPSHTYRLWLQHYRPRKGRPRGFVVRRLRSKNDGQEINRLYSATGFVQVPLDHFAKNRNSRRLTYLVAEDEATGALIGSITGVDHHHCFNDPERGASLWCLAVDPQSPIPGIGEALIRALAEHFEARGRSFLDLSVMHDNEPAIALYEKLGFKRLPLFTVKCRNPYNEPLYTAPEPRERLRYDSEVIIREARRRGISVEIEDAEAGLFQLILGGRRVSCSESTCDLISAVAHMRCEDRALTQRLFKRANLPVPDQIEAGDPDEEAAFLERHGRIVVKPGWRNRHAPVTVDVRDMEGLADAIAATAPLSDRVLLEQQVPGDTLRVLVIENRVVAGAIRRPAEIVGNGQATVRQLLEIQSRRRAAATGGESRIPLDAETKSCIMAAGYGLDGVPEDGEAIALRKTPKLFTGGTVHDVTAMLHPRIVEASIEAARTLDIPVVGIDFIAEKPTEPDFYLVGADPQPSLSHHGPQPAANRFLDMLFPQTEDRTRR